MPLSDTTPTTVSLIEGDKLLYTGTCSMQVSITLADSRLSTLKTVPGGSFYEAPVTGDYVLTIAGACCNVGDYEVFPTIDDGETTQYELCCLRRIGADEPAMRGWASATGDGSSVTVAIFSADGGTELSLDEFEIVNCC